jgi:hypothetical protein
LLIEIDQAEAMANQGVSLRNLINMTNGVVGKKRKETD